MHSWCFFLFFLQSLKLIQKIGKTATEVKHFAGKSLHFTHFYLNNATNSTTAETKLLFILKLTNTYDARKSEQAHIPHAPPLLENTVYNEWQFQALVTGNRTENQFHLSCTK